MHMLNHVIFALPWEEYAGFWVLILCYLSLGTLRFLTTSLTIFNYWQAWFPILDFFKKKFNISSTLSLHVYHSARVWKLPFQQSFFPEPWFPFLTNRKVESVQSCQQCSENCKELMDEVGTLAKTCSLPPKLSLSWGWLSMVAWSCCFLRGSVCERRRPSTSWQSVNLWNLGKEYRSRFKSAAAAHFPLAGFIWDVNWKKQIALNPVVTWLRLLKNH